ncbi:hypothetical protein EVU94_07860 [Flavobacteriaceae bacterium 144Ye]|nr:hypothetical protein EVU94_07860 [Flavobacteriaceae bacterium 144Ye]
MKRILILVFVALVGFSFKSLHSTKVQINISPESTLWVDGSTNINTFRCDFDVKTLTSKVPVTYKIDEEKNEIQFVNASLYLNNSNFDCGNKGMNKDFYKLLKSDMHPEVALTLNSIKINPDTKQTTTALVTIEMAGCSKMYKTQVTISKTKAYEVKGELTIDILDFNLEPPQKMLGLVKVKKEITIRYNLILSP